MPAFKILGVAYAVEQLGCGNDSVLCTMTDGNHGLAVATVAKQRGMEAVVYVPRTMAEARAAALRTAGAKVVRTDGTYDEAVAAVRAAAERNGWVLVSDTAWAGYEAIPQAIMAGYGTIFREVETQRRDSPPITHIVVQAGVGGLAGAAAAWLARRRGASAVWADDAELIIVEPNDAACLYENEGREADALQPCAGATESIMAGLNCGVPSTAAWPLIAGVASRFMAVGDDWAEEAVRTMHAHGIAAGESGAAGLAGFLALEPLPPGAVVLLLNTEGVTEPELTRRILATPSTPS